MGLKVVTDNKGVKVYRKERQTSNGNTFATYSLGVSSKDMSGNFVNGYIDCLFKKGVEVENKAKIEITNSFYTVNEYNGNKYVKLFILDFNVVEHGEPLSSVGDGFISVVDSLNEEELPFE